METPLFSLWLTVPQRLCASLPSPKFFMQKREVNCWSNMLSVSSLQKDIVSDRGPQFIYQVWKLFWSALGAILSLCSGYHPQANGKTERANQSLQSTHQELADFCPALTGINPRFTGDSHHQDVPFYGLPWVSPTVIQFSGRWRSGATLNG